MSRPFIATAVMALMFASGVLVGGVFGASFARSLVPIDPAYWTCTAQDAAVAARQIGTPEDAERIACTAWVRKPFQEVPQ